MERKDFDRDHREVGAEDNESRRDSKKARPKSDMKPTGADSGESTRPAGHTGEAGTSGLESMMADMGYTDEGAAKDFERQGDVTDFTRKSQDADFSHEPPGKGFTLQGGGSSSRQDVGTGPKPYTGSQSGPSTGSSGQMSSSRSAGHTGGSMDFGSSRYVGMGKIAKQVGVDVQELRACAQSHGIVADKHRLSCDMFSQGKANEIMQTCGTGLSAG